MKKIGRFMAGMDKFRKEIGGVEQGLREVPHEAATKPRTRGGEPGDRVKSAARKRKSAPKKSAKREKEIPAVNRQEKPQKII